MLLLCPPTKRVLTSPDHPNAGIVAYYLIPITTALRAEKLAKGMTLVLPMKSHAIFAEVLPKNSLLKSTTDVDMLESKKCPIPEILLKMMLWTFSGSQADLEGAAENLFASPPHPQPLHFESLS